MGHKRLKPDRDAIRFKDYSPDERASLSSLIAKGIPPERIAASTGAPLRIIRAMKELAE